MNIRSKRKDKEQYEGGKIHELKKKEENNTKGK